MSQQPDSPSTIDPVRIFVSYAREDQRWLIQEEKYQLIPFLADALQWNEAFFWFDSRLRPGDDFKHEIGAEIDQSQIALLLVTQSFLNSRYIREHEMPRINERVKRGDMILVPLLVERCFFAGYPFLTDRQMTPERPLISYTVNDNSWSEVRIEILKGLVDTVEGIRQKQIRKRRIDQAASEAAQQAEMQEKLRLEHEEAQREAQKAKQREADELVLRRAQELEERRVAKARLLEREALKAAEETRRLEQLAEESRQAAERNRLAQEAARRRREELRKTEEARQAEIARLENERLAMEATARAEEARLEQEYKARLEAAAAVERKKAEELKQQKLQEEQRRRLTDRLALDKQQFAERIKATTMPPRLSGKFDAMAEVERQTQESAQEALKNSAQEAAAASSSDYHQAATRLSPGRIIFLLDRSASMMQPFRDGSRMDTLNNLLFGAFDRLIGFSTRGELISPRFRVAVAAYADGVQDLVGGFVPIDRIADQEFLPLLAAHPQDSVESSDVCQAFQWALELLRADMGEQDDLPAPIICHLTDGDFSSDAGDPEPIAHEIQTLSTKDGAVLIHNIFIGPDFMENEFTSLVDWPGPMTEEELKSSQVRRLFRMSSALPESRASQIGDLGYSLLPGSRLLHPGAVFTDDLLAFSMPPTT